MSRDDRTSFALPDLAVNPIIYPVSATQFARLQRDA
jgi:hypothetical protein